MINNNQLLYQPLIIDPTPLTNLSMYNRIYETVSAAVKLEIFKHLKTGKTPDELAAELNLDGKVVLAVFKALVAVGALSETEGRFFSTPLADTYLNRESVLYLGQEFDAGNFGNQLIQALTAKREGGCQKIQPLDRERLRQIGAIGLMGSIQSTIAGSNLKNAANMLDLGGGHGLFSIAFAQKYPSLKVTLFDLPNIVPLAQEYVQRFAMEGRIDFVAGDFLKDDIGKGYDAILCANVLHSTGRDIVLAKAYNALNECGQLIVKTRIRISDAQENMANCSTALLLQVRGSRELHSFPEWEGFLENHGFKKIKMTALTGIFATITAQKGEKSHEGCQ